MNAQTKSKEIYDKMKGFRVKNTHRKKCALIVCDEVIEALLSMDNVPYEKRREEREFWEEVTNEIEKL